MRGKIIIFCFKLVLITKIIEGEAQEVTYEEDVLITAREKQALDKFKAIAIPKIPKNSLIQNYVNDDLYFIKWLRAFEMARNAKNGHSLGQRFPDFVREYTFLHNVTDKRHRPSAELWFSDWKFRDSALAGKGSETIRWFITGIERLQRQIYEARSKGLKVSQAVLVVDIDGFSLVQQGCPLCLPIIAGLTLSYVRQYPGLLESAIAINSPPTFDIVLRATKPILGSEGKLLKVFAGKNRWTPFVNGRYERNQLTPRCGGTRDR